MGKALKIKFYKETEEAGKEREKKYRRFLFKRTGIFFLLISIILFVTYQIVYVDFFNLMNKNPLNYSENVKAPELILNDSAISREKQLPNDLILNNSIDKVELSEDRFLSKKYILNDSFSGYYGINVTEWQQTINWDMLYNNNESFPIKFVLIKATQGANSIDKQFETNWEKAQNPIVNIGAYHVFILGDDPQQQAENFINNVKLSKGDILPIVELGVNYSRFENMEISKTELINRLSVFLIQLEEEYGAKPILYTCYQFYDDYFLEELIGYKYMFAHYFSTPLNGMLTRGITKPQLAPFVFIWQYSYSGDVNGITATTRMNFVPKEKMDAILLTE